MWRGVRILISGNSSYPMKRTSTVISRSSTASICRPIRRSEKVKFDASHRSGIVTHPYILSTLAYPPETSPIHRGVFLGRGMLGINIKPPQEAFTPIAADLPEPDDALNACCCKPKPNACSGCHSIMNPSATALENFDAVGRVPRKENAIRRLTLSGSYEAFWRPPAKFTGAKELAKVPRGQ